MSRRGSSLPEFRASQQVGGSGIADASGGARSLTQLGQRIQQFGQQQLVQGAVQKATQEGEMAGMDPNFKPSRFGGAAGRAFNNAALATNRHLMGTDIILNTERMKIDASKSSPDAAVQLQNFNKMSSQYGEQILNQSPTANKAYVQNMMNYHVGRAQIDMAHNIQTQQRIKGSAQWLQSDNVFHADTLQAVNHINFNQSPEGIENEVTAAGALLTQRNNATQLAAQGGFISSKTSFNQIRDNNVEFNRELITAQFRGKLKEGGSEPQEFIKQILDDSLKGPNAGALKGMNFGERNKLAGQLLSEQKKFSNATGQSKAQLSHEAKDETIRVENGGVPNKVLRNTFVATNPSKQVEYDNNIQDAQLTFNLFDSAQNASFDEQKLLFDQARPTDTKNANFARKLRIVNNAQSKINQQNHRISQDPVAFFASDVSVTNSLNQKAQELKSGVNFDAMKSNGIKPLSPTPINNIVTAQLMKGYPLSEVDILDKGQANKVANLLKSKAPTVDKINSLRSLQSSYGRWYPQLMNQLVRENKISSNESFLGSLSPSDPDLPVIDQALNTPRKVLESNIDEQRLNDLKSIMQGSLQGRTSRSTIFPGITHTQKSNRNLSDFEDSYLSFAANGTAEFLNNTKDFMHNVSLSIMNQDHGISASDAWLQASNKIAGKFNYTTLNGKTQRVPLQFSPDVVSKYAKDQEKKIKNFPFVLGRLSNGKKLTRDQEIKMNISTGGWVTNSNNDGWIWVRQDGALLRNEKGNPFEFKFRDAMSNSTENHTESTSQFGDFQKPSESEIKVQQMLAKMATAKL